MFKFKRLLALTLACAGLAACSTVDGMGRDVGSVFGSEDNAGVTTVYESSPLERPPVVYTEDESGAVVPELPSDPLALAGKYADGNVQVFSLDEPAGPAAAPAEQYASTPYIKDADVMVYPVDQSADQFAPPAMMPPAQQGFASPFTPSGELMPFPQNEIPRMTAGMMPAPQMQAPAQEQIFFSHGSARVGAGDAKRLTGIAGQAQASRAEVVVEGYASKRAEVADPVERQIVNLTQSMKRAVNVSSALMRQGVPADQIKAVAYGEGHPAAPIGGKDAEAASRRVDIHTGAMFQ